MANHRVFCAVIISAWLLHMAPIIDAWGKEGHTIICKIAQARLSDTAASAVKELLPKSAEGDLSSFCLWADKIKFRYRWSSPLHYLNTPDSCSYKYSRDCKDEDGERGRCVAGAINNYTTQLLSYNAESSSKSEYNLTESLLFLSHFMGDIHQPLHTAFASDKGGNTIDVHWYRRKESLHHVRKKLNTKCIRRTSINTRYTLIECAGIIQIWDVNIIETAEENLYDSNVEEMIDAIQKNITTEWANQVKRWERCSKKTACPDIYASEGIKAACDWAYKGVTEGETLEDEYFYSRLPIVNLRLAQAAVRLAATLNRIFG
ncbi:PREDICTED: endonuclease 2 [Tarenaya hassleriana]|uniref:endonuclease 2 n=1 Tax=Tarenaya hassleriana TaxID=28532 RepID=UPI00053C6301|nr:PREDICTED: endonuclease 2 [Tarenaya hassleriana]